MSKCVSCGHRAEEEFQYCPTCGTRTVVPGEDADPLLGRILNGKYRVVSQIGAGAMGTVYQGEHMGLRKKVALKVLHSDMQVSEESLQRFQREGIAAGKFNHPGAIQIFDFDRDGQVIYLAMEFIEGANLKVFLRKKGRLAVPAAVDIMSQVLSVLAEAHQQGIVHRDLKPDNIMVLPSSSGQLSIKVLDFGLSKLIDSRKEGSMQTQVGRILGTPLYMAPEQCAGEEVDHRSDLYAAGLIFYELLTGITPFPDESTTEILFTRATREAPSLTDSHPDIGVPVDLDAILQRALERRRDARFQSASEMLEALREVRFDIVVAPRARQTPAVRPAAVAVPSGTKWTRSLRWDRILGLVVLVGFALYGAWALWLSGPSVPDVPRHSMKAEEFLTGEERAYVATLRLVRNHLGSPNHDAAMREANNAVRAPCADSEAYLLRAEVYRALHDDDTALADLQDALGKDPLYAEAATACGWIHFDHERDAKALEWFDTALAIDPRAADALAGKGALLVRAGDPKGARELLEEAFEIDHTSATVLLHLGLLQLAAGETDAALENLVDAKRRDVRSWRAASALGEAYLAKGDLDNAENQFRQARDRNPGALEVLNQLASRLVEAERWSEANEVLSGALDSFPDSPRANVLMGLVLHQEEDFEGAIERLERGLEEGGGDARLHTLLGLLHAALDNRALAYEQFEAAIALDDRYALPYLDEGLLLLEEGEFERAKPLLTRALDLDEDLPRAHLALGVIEMDYIDEPARALEHFTRFVELGGRDPRVDEWIEKLSD